MATSKNDPGGSNGGNGNGSGNGNGNGVSSSAIDAMLYAALERGDDSLETGRYLITYKEGALDEGAQALRSQGVRAADARDFEDQSIGALDDIGDADALILPEIGVAVVDGAAFAARGLSTFSAAGEDDAHSPIQTIEPEYFAFADDLGVDYMKGFRRATDAIAADFGLLNEVDQDEDEDVDGQVLGATWGLLRTKAALSLRSGLGIRVAVLDTGMDLGHPDFIGRPFRTATFVGQPVQDLHSHGTHCIGTACGPRAPAGPIPRYGCAHRSTIFVGKVLTNTGSGTSGSVLAGMNWAIANRCEVISMSLGSNSPVQAAYTAAGAAALSRGLLIIAAAGNSGGGPTGAPANSPTIVSVSSVDPSLVPSSFSSVGKVEIAGPGRDVFSSVPRPTRHGVKSGTSMACPHVAGIAAMWAESHPSLRGLALLNRLRASARPLPFPASKVGRGLVQAP